MTLIWASRGQHWGFRFLLRGGFTDPLPQYDAVFSEAESEPSIFVRVDSKVGLRFGDPLQRKDAAGRTIPHEFVVFPPFADKIDSVEKGIELVWPLVADDYAAVWNQPDPPRVSS